MKHTTNRLFSSFAAAILLTCLAAEGKTDQVLREPYQDISEEVRATTSRSRFDLKKALKRLDRSEELRSPERAAVIRELSLQAAQDSKVKKALMKKVVAYWSNWWESTGAFDALTPLAASDLEARAFILEMVKNPPKGNFLESSYQFSHRTTHLIKEGLRVLVPLFPDDAEVKATITGLLDDVDGFTRLSGIKALSSLACREEGIKDLILKKLSDEESRVRFWAVKALSCASGEKAVKDALTKMLDDRQEYSHWVRGAAVTALIDYCHEPEMQEKMTRALDYRRNPCSPDLIEYYRKGVPFTEL